MTQQVFPLHPEKTKKCSWFLVFQANRPHVYYHQLIGSASSVTRSLQNHQLLCMETVTYKLETAEPKPAAQLCFQREIGGHRSHGLALGPSILQKTHTTKNCNVLSKHMEQTLQRILLMRILNVNVAKQVCTHVNTQRNAERDTRHR